MSSGLRMTWTQCLLLVGVLLGAHCQDSQVGTMLRGSSTRVSDDLPQLLLNESLQEEIQIGNETAPRSLSLKDKLQKVKETIKNFHEETIEVAYALHHTLQVVAAGPPLGYDLREADESCPCVKSKWICPCHYSKKQYEKGECPCIEKDHGKIVVQGGLRVEQKGVPMEFHEFDKGCTLLGFKHKINRRSEIKTQFRICFVDYNVTACPQAKQLTMHRRDKLGGKETGYYRHCGDFMPPEEVLP